MSNASHKGLVTYDSVAAKHWVTDDLSMELSGAIGTNRSMDPHRKRLITVETDRAAIEEWLRLSVSNPNTARSYAKEAYRFLLWATTFKKRPISL